MTAKASDLARIQEMYDIVCQTQRQLKALNITKKRFLDPSDDAEDLIAEGIMNRVFRVAEEGGRLSEECAERYRFNRKDISGVRNRLAHAYGEVDRNIIWTVLERDFSEIKKTCELFCEEQGVDLHESEQ